MVRRLVWVVPQKAFLKSKTTTVVMWKSCRRYTRGPWKLYDRQNVQCIKKKVIRMKISKNNFSITGTYVYGTRVLGLRRESKVARQTVTSIETPFFKIIVSRHYTPVKLEIKNCWRRSAVQRSVSWWKRIYRLKTFYDSNHVLFRNNGFPVIIYASADTLTKTAYLAPGRRSSWVPNNEF